MYKLASTIRKELIILLRDRAGLLLLFLMPSILVVIICLVQENVLKNLGETKLKVLLVNEDTHEIGRKIASGLKETGTLSVITRQGHGKADMEEAIETVKKGKYQVLVHIPKEFLEKLQKEKETLTLSTYRDEPTNKNAPPLITVYFDPAVRGNFRSLLIYGLRETVLSYEMEEKSEIIARQVTARLEEYLPPVYPLESLSREISLEISKIGKRPLISIEEKTALDNSQNRMPTSTQHNVPAWALFGMFFVVVPMASTLLNERRQATLARLFTMPVSPLTILAGKIAAYFIVCISQFLLILLIGIFVLPALGTPELSLGPHPAALFLMVAASALAATGYGVMLGTISQTYEQASMFGPISIVIAAALGGIMVPSYAMPEAMQKISAFSPLSWGLNGFLELFVRNGGLYDILPNLELLLSFFAVTTAVAWRSLFQGGTASP